MKHKRMTIIVLVTLCMVIGWGMMTVGAAEKSFPKIIAVGSGPVGGGFNMIVVGISKYWEKDVGVTASVAPGVAKTNLHRFADKRLDVMISPSTWMYAAWHARQDYGFEESIKDIRVMYYIYGNPYYVIALEKSGLRKISDLKGKRVGIGPNADTWDKMMGKKLEANGIKYFGENPDIRKTFASYQDMCQMLGDGNLDAAVAMFEGLVPQPATQKLMEERELVALEWDPAVFEKFKTDIFPPALIKKELLPFLEKDHYCWEGGMAAMVARDDVSEELVYQLTKSTHRNLEQLASENPFWKYPVKYPEMLTKDTGIPYHPGAIRYWKEIGIWQR